jgi:hypothetical protein
MGKTHSMKDMSTRTATLRWTIGWARRSLVVATFAAFGAVGACGGSADAPTGPGTPVVPVVPAPTSPVGNYDIKTVNGNPVPVVIASDGNYKQEFTAGTVALGADTKYTVVLTTRITIPGNVQTFVDSTAGTWTQTATSIELTNAADGSKLTGTWDKGLLTFVSAEDKATYVYAQKP